MIKKKEFLQQIKLKEKGVATFCFDFVQHPKQYELSLTIIDDKTITLTLFDICRKAYTIKEQTIVLTKKDNNTLYKLISQWCNSAITEYISRRGRVIND